MWSQYTSPHRGEEDLVGEERQIEKEWGIVRVEVEMIEGNRNTSPVKRNTDWKGRKETSWNKQSLD